LKNTTQFRLSYGTGFRAPQAFDTDLHIAFAGGGVSRVQLSNQLTEERSQSISASVNFDKATESYVIGYTFEAFRTTLSDAFVLTNIGRDTFGEIFVKENGNGARVQGITLELRANLQKKIQLETGFTLQQSVYEMPVTYIDGTEPLKEFLRTPDDYGFANLSWTPTPYWNINGNYVYTGRMKVAHFGGAENFPNDELVISPRFSEFNMRISYTIPLKIFESALECYGGVKNIFNAYQEDFDIGKFRDSNYVYGPAMPRSLFVGIKIKSF
jgi:outer membrane receptor for ferrienterochelin and colicins